ncbi:sigma-54-dependent Fis family transcriptional regulator [Bacillus piscicola]|uniref:sigma-54-dependent Fis family transcriptional regulator n=1 Tax=Bacillus piscicola TaxID=1632684 RepID=UPI001F098C71|nr:sigma-54-dependent Fis family transcriptional regulator [Bacillus piscicola]
MLVPSSSVRNEFIQKSWQRCQNQNFEPRDSPPEQHISSHFVKELQSKNEKLLHFAVPVFEKITPVIERSHHMASLIDKDGRIVYTAGKEASLGFTKTENLQIGINWSEERRGTNAVSLVLAEKTPIILQGAEHFFEENQLLTCAANPIYGADGTLIGVINVYSKVDLFDRTAISVAQMAAESIQNKMIVDQIEREKFVAINELDRVSDHHPQPLISLDNNEVIIRANEAARRLLGEHCVGTVFTKQDHFRMEIISDTANKYWKSFAVHTPSPEKPKKNSSTLYSFADIVGSCPTLKKQIHLGKKAAATDLSILLHGESGTGKELFAQSIHTESARSSQPFVAVNCGAIPENLIESELFGYEKGAFTGANQHGQIGKFEAAHGGTLFLDEIGDMPPRAQVSLLRVLQERAITPVGSTKVKPVDVRIIAATHRSLPEEIQAGRFRSDLYYRLKEIQLNLPSLHNRTDLMEIAAFILEQLQPPKKLAEQAKAAVQKHHWPGNFRELKSTLQQAAFLADTNVIEAEDLQMEEKITNSGSQPILSLVESESRVIKQALEASDWNIKKSAEWLGITRNRLYRKIELYGLEQSNE